jgi:4-methyl-5(b-hydroxyethyl)-thiazole monophosphate biosynthesis
MKEIYLFLAEGFEEVEALTVVDIIRRGGLNIKTVSTTGELTVTSSHNVKITADLLFKDVDTSNASMMVLPGGMPGALNLERHAGLRTALLAQFHAGKPLAAICAAPLVFGHLGILEGKRATCYPGFDKELKGATYTGELVTVDGNITTGKGPAAAMKFGFTILAYFAGEEKATEVMSGMLFR